MSAWYQFQVLAEVGDCNASCRSIGVMPGPELLPNDFQELIIEW